MERKPIGLSTPYRKIKKDKDGWVGLTDEEILDMIKNNPYKSAVGLCRAIEIKLKEKNT